MRCLRRYAVGFAVWLLVWQSTDVGSGHIISAGLCQISEFSFVLASRGTRLGIIPQPVSRCGHASSVFIFQSGFASFAAVSYLGEGLLTRYT